MSLVTVSTLREYLPEIANNTEIDTELGYLLDRVEMSIANYLGFPMIDSNLSPTLASSLYTVYVDNPKLDDPYCLQLPFKPVTEITSIHADSSREYSTETLIDPATYDLEKAAGRVVLKVATYTRPFSNGKRANKIICTAGYTAGTLPDDLEHGICVFASMLHRNKTSQGKNSMSTRSGNVTFSPKKMPEEVKEFIYPYRSPGLIL